MKNSPSARIHLLSASISYIFCKHFRSREIFPWMEMKSCSGELYQNNRRRHNNTGDLSILRPPAIQNDHNGCSREGFDISGQCKKVFADMELCCKEFDGNNVEQQRISGTCKIQ